MQRVGRWWCALIRIPREVSYIRELRRKNTVLTGELEVAVRMIGTAQEEARAASDELKALRGKYAALERAHREALTESTRFEEEKDGLARRNGLLMQNLARLAGELNRAEESRGASALGVNGRCDDLSPRISGRGGRPKEGNTKRGERGALFWKDKYDGLVYVHVVIRRRITALADVLGISDIALPDLRNDGVIREVFSRLEQAAQTMEARRVF